MGIFRDPGEEYESEQRVTYTFQFRDVFAAWEFLLDGLILTLELSLFTMVMGLVIGIAGAAGRVYGPAWVRRPIAVYVEAIRNTPLIVQLFLIFFGLPSAASSSMPTPPRSRRCRSTSAPTRSRSCAPGSRRSRARRSRPASRSACRAGRSSAT